MTSAAARALWVLGWPARAALLGLIHLYRLTLGQLVGGRCRFYPSCSAYAAEAVRTHGAAKGMILATWRLLRCTPLSLGGPDPVPARGAWRPALYDRVIPRGGDG
jgi:putative membrane protein insertion efficiency factor